MSRAPQRSSNSKNALPSAREWVDAGAKNPDDFDADAAMAGAGSSGDSQSSGSPDSSASADSSRSLDSGASSSESNDADRIRQRAYELWEGEGRPEDRADEHWLQAEREVSGQA